MDLRVILRRLRRRYREPVIKFLFRLFRYLPRSVTYILGNFIGWAIWASHGELRKTTETNVSVCFPELKLHDQQNISKESFYELGRAAAEIPLLWTASKEEILGLVKGVEGIEHIDAAIKEGKGVICLTPHLGAWEIMGLYLSIYYPMTTLYRPPQLSSLEDIIIQGRTRFGVNLVPTDAAGVRGLLKALKKGEMLGILPDQDPGPVGGAFSPFFNVQANTMTLVSRLAQKTGAAVIVCFAERLPKSGGYMMHIQAPLEEVCNKDLSISLAALNEGVESYIRAYPQQYQWSYKRFKTRPEGEARFY